MRKPIHRPRVCPETDKNLAVIKIGEVAKLTGLSPSVLRAYESLGLVLPYKEENGQRLYSMDDIYALRKFAEATQIRKVPLGQISWLIRSAPLKSFRCLDCKEQCEVAGETGAQACWEVWADDPEWRRACRACPAYLARDRVLDFHSHFEVKPRGPRSSWRAKLNSL